jgi:hypothetical protein
MSLYLKQENQMIYMRRGDTGIVQFVFDKPMDGVFVTFAVKKNQSDKDEDAVITKSCLCGKDPFLSPRVAYFIIDPEDTAYLDIEPEKPKFDFQDYVWMLKIETDYGRLADTVIPCRTFKFPKFRLYYGSVPDFNKEETIR